MPDDDIRFIERHGLWTEDQSKQADALIKRIEKEGIRNIRIGWGDQHGTVRGKTVTAEEFKANLRGGKDFQLLPARPHAIVLDLIGEPIASVRELTQTWLTKDL